MSAKSQIGHNSRMSPHRHKRLGFQRAALIVLVLALLTLGLYWLELAVPKRDYFLERRGTLVRQDILQSSDDGVVHKTVQLESSTGLQVDMRLMRPATGPGETLPVIIVMGGEGTGKDAVDLVGAPRGVAYLALDYPYRGNQELDAFWESVSAIPAIQQAFLDSPPAMSLAVDWLQQQPWFDPGNVELVGASLGVPFTAVLTNASRVSGCCTVAPRTCHGSCTSGGATSRTSSCAASSHEVPCYSFTAILSRRLTGYTRLRRVHS